MAIWLKKIKKKNLGSYTIWEGTLNGICEESFFAKYEDGVLTVTVNDSVVFCGDVESETGNSYTMTTEQMLSRINFRR